MNTALTVHQIQGADGSFELRVSGEIDLSNVEVFSAALDAALPADDDILIVDLTAVNYLDSAAINALFGRADHIRIIANPLLNAVLTVSGIADLIAVDVAGD